MNPAPPTIDVLFSLAPTAPRDLLTRISGVLAEQPAPDVLLLISEGLNEAAETYQAEAHRHASDLRQLAIVIAAGVPSIQVPRRRISLAEQLHTALVAVVEYGQCGGWREGSRQGKAWRQAFDALQRYATERGGSP